MDSVTVRITKSYMSLSTWAAAEASVILINIFAIAY